jgi:pimeloyl-ACP methyl ester carboxylesterase
MNTTTDSHSDSPSDSHGDPYAKPKVRLLSRARGIAYVDAGSADHAPLLLIHGSLCDYRYWKPQLLGLSASHHVIAPSLAHHHPRLPSAQGQVFSWRAHVEQLSEFIDKLGSAAIHVVGHSRGACVAYQLALLRGSRLASLTLIDPGGPNEVDGDAAMPDEVRETRAHALQLIADGQVDDGLRLFVDSTSRPGFWDRSAPVFQGMARDNAATLAPQMADPLPAYNAVDAARIACPTLLFQGERSPAMYRRNADLLAQWIPGAASITMSGASHGMSWSHPQAFNRQLQAFLKK